MAKILILTLILCFAAATFAGTETGEGDTSISLTTDASPDSTVTEPPTPATDTATTEPPTPATDTATTEPPIPATDTASTEPPTPATDTAATEPPTAATDTAGSAATEPSTEGTPQTGVATTEDPNASSIAPVTTGTQAPATTAPPGVCASNPCGGGSTCEERAGDSFVCLCLTGDLFLSGTCVRVKVFPGKLTLKETFDPTMSDKKSAKFQETSKKITDEIDKKFKTQNEFAGSSVLELREAKLGKERAEPARGKVEASIELHYGPDSDITEKDVETTMKEVACETCPLAGSFAVEGLCDSDPCDNKTTTCESLNGGFKCSCKDGLTSTAFSDRICSGCPAGQKYENSKCVPCGTGYSGIDCKNNTNLILIIVASILGGLLIIALILLPILTTKSKKKSSKSKDEDFEKPYHSHSVAKAPVSHSESNGYSLPVKDSANGLAGGSGAPRIPRATTSNNWDSRTNLEMTPSNSRQNLISSGHNSRFDDNQDDMMSFSHSRPKNNPYEQIRPSSNPYAQNRSMNPYAQNRGQTNPYFN